MWFKHRAWIPVAWLLSLGNLVFVWTTAAGGGAPMHVAGHAALAVLFALGARRLSDRQRGGMDDEQLQQTIDGMHARVQELEERLDFTERLLAQRRDPDHHDAPPR